MLRFTPALWRYEWLILSITLAGFGAGWSALPLVAPQYEARATVLAQAVEVPGARPVRPDNLLSSRSLQELLKTSLVLAPVVNEFHLAHGSDAESERETVESLAERLRVRVRQDDGGDLLSVSLVGSDPEQTATVLNAVVERFVAAAVDLKSEKLSALASHFEQQRVRAQQWLPKAKEELERFRLQYPPSIPRVPADLAETQDPVVNLYWTLKREQEKLRAERAVLEEASKDDPDIQALLAELRDQELALETRIKTVGEQLRAIRPRYIEEEGLEQRVRNAERFYKELTMRHEAALLTVAQSLADLRLLDPAVPPHRPLRRGSPTSLLLLLIVISLCVAVADAFLLDWLDRRLENSYRV